MSNLLELNSNNSVELNKIWIQMIPEFKKVYARDKNKSKAQARKEFTFIYLYCDFTSPYYSYPLERRAVESAESANVKVGIEKSDKLILQAIEKYNQVKKTRALRLIESAFRGLDKISEMYNDLADEEGRLDIKAAKDMQSMISGLRKTVNECEALERQVIESLSGNGRVRGGVEEGTYED